MINYDPQLVKSMQDSPDSVFQDGNQRLLHAACDIRETETDYVVSFLPGTGRAEEEITFDFMGCNLFISGGGNPEFSVGVHSRSQPVEARYNNGVLQLRLPKSAIRSLR